MARLCANSPLPAGLKLLQAAGFSLSSRQREASETRSKAARRSRWASHLRGLPAAWRQDRSEGKAAAGRGAAEAPSQAPEEGQLGGRPRYAVEWCGGQAGTSYLPPFEAALPAALPVSIPSALGAWWEGASRPLRATCGSCCNLG